MRNRLLLLFTAVWIFQGVFSYSNEQMAVYQNNKKMKKTNYYCEYCGRKFDSVRTLTGLYCTRHPNGAGKGKHKLYEGSEKSEYLCKYCGRAFKDLSTLTGLACTRHPKGSIKGKHSPAL